MEEAMQRIAQLTCRWNSVESGSMFVSITSLAYISQRGGFPSLLPKDDELDGMRLSGEAVVMKFFPCLHCLWFQNTWNKI